MQDKPAFRFSLRAAFVVMTAIAIILGITVNTPSLLLLALIPAGPLLVSYCKSYFAGCSTGEMKGVFALIIGIVIVVGTLIVIAALAWRNA